MSFASYIKGKRGQHFPPPTKREVPVGFKRPETTEQLLARLMRSSEFAKRVASEGLETFEEADDFDIPDDPYPLPNTPYEKDFDMAAGAAAQHGVVALPSPEQVEKAKGVLARLKEATSKLKSGSAAGDPAAIKEPAGDPA